MALSLITDFQEFRTFTPGEDSIEWAVNPVWRPEIQVTLDALMDAGKARLRERWPAATLYVLDDNPRARRFYEREGWALDGETKTGMVLGLEVAEVRYRISFEEAGRTSDA